MLGGAFFIIIVAFLLFKQNRLKQKSNELLVSQNKKITAQNEIIEDKNKNITDSITYAKRIQKAALTSDEERL